MRQEVVESAEQEVAKAASLRVGSAQRTFLPEVHEEILRILAPITVAPDEGVDRIAVNGVKFPQRSLSFWRVYFSRGDHQGPLRSH